MGNELEIGKRYTWEEVVEAYPGKWVRMSDCNLTVWFRDNRWYFGWGLYR